MLSSNPLQNHRGITINMIEKQDDRCMVKSRVLVGPNKLEKLVASPSISEKVNSTSMTSHQVFASVSREGQNKKGINHVLPNSLPHLCQSFLVDEYSKRIESPLNFFVLLSY